MTDPLTLANRMSRLGTESAFEVLARARTLEAQGRKAAVATGVESDGIGRYPQDLEAAVYFCALEAMQNVAKHAEATSVIVRLAERDRHLVFEVKDDGRGFDSGAAGYGTGLQGMADRLDAVRGSLDVRSAPGRGTTVVGRLPVPASDPASSATIRT